MGIDIFEVIEAAASKPFGFTLLSRPWFGGHIFQSTLSTSLKAKEFGVNTRFIELAGEVNSGMPSWVVGKGRGCLKYAWASNQR